MVDAKDFHFDQLKMISHPDNVRSHLLSIEAVVKFGKLHLLWHYNSCFHAKKTIETLAQQYKSSLRVLIKSCSNADQIYPLLPLQKGLLFHGLYTVGSEAYMTQVVWRNPKSITLDLIVLKQAFESLLVRHELLRACFIWEGLDEPVQHIKTTVNLPWKIYDWSLENNLSVTYEESSFALEKRLSSFLKADREISFQFDQAPLMRITVIKLPHDRHYVILTVHHVLLDGWSLSIVLEELDAYYQAGIQNKTIELPTLFSYPSYFASLEKLNSAKTKEFWVDYLRGYSGVSMDWALESSPSVQLKGENLNQVDGMVDIVFEDNTLSNKLSRDIKLFCQRHTITLNTLFQGLWALLLHYYSQDETVVFGATLSGRSPEVSGIETMVGLLINTLPFRVDFNAALSVKDYLLHIQNNAAMLTPYQTIPLTDLQQSARLAHGAILFNTILVFENYPVNDQSAHYFKFEDFQIIDPTHYPLSCIIVPGDQLTVRFAYDLQKMNHAFIKRLEEHFQSLLRQFIQYPGKNIQTLSLLTSKAYQEVIINWNKTYQAYPLKQTVHALFESQVKKTPNNVAVIFEDQSLTYQELNNRANQLAHYLHQKGILAEDFVAVCVSRGFEMLISLLAVMKVGGAYVPVDPDYPKERVNLMLEDCCPRFIITQKSLEEKIQSAKMPSDRYVFIDEQHNIQAQSIDNLSFNIKSNQLFYCIYTSGSTGKPKGVLVEHRSVVNLLIAMQSEIQLNATDKLLAVTPMSFDISGLEFYLPLIIGASVVIADRKTTQDGMLLKEVLEEQSITVLQATPMLWKILIEAGWKGNNSLKALCGGEALPQTLVEQLLPCVSQLWNVYGPTETTIWSTIFAIRTVGSDHVLPIGKPISNTQTYVLNSDYQPVPVGMIGELYIGGEGLARGYLKQNEITNQRFITHHFDDGTVIRLYRTGDLVRWLPEGQLEYLGRNDDQIKMNGFRIELGEIQSALKKHPAVKEACVIVNKMENCKQWLSAFFVENLNVSVEPDSLRKLLKYSLPSHCIPSEFIKIDKLPLTINGKIDKKALEKVAADNSLQKEPNGSQSPQNEIEKILIEIWQQVLSVRLIGIKDNFFELGGHSLTALQTLSEINKAFNVHLTVRTIFENPMLCDVALAIKRQQSDNKTLSLIAKQKNHIDKNNCLIPLKPDGKKTPLFLIHPIGGTVFWYIPLVKYFDPDRPLYAIQDPGIDSSHIPFDDVQEMAHFYLDLVKIIQPKGPYLLGGASAGGNISVEMAHQLKMRNESVDFIGLLDAWSIYPESLQNSEFFESVMRRQYQCLHSEFIAKGVTQADSLIELQLRRSKMNHCYIPPHLQMPLNLFKAEVILPLFKTIESATNHWKGYSPEIITYQVPGDHETMFQEPNITVLANYLNLCLDEIASQHSLGQGIN
jgi:amino acid adenylation domain-containing protein